jgi:hypothetical protein
VHTDVFNALKIEKYPASKFNIQTSVFRSQYIQTDDSPKPIPNPPTKWEKEIWFSAASCTDPFPSGNPQPPAAPPPTLNFTNHLVNRHLCVHPGQHTLMVCCAASSSEEDSSKSQVSSVIDKQLKHDERKVQSQVKLLLLGLCPCPSIRIRGHS